MEGSLKKRWRNMVCLSRPYPFKFFKGCLSQNLLSPLLNTLLHLFCYKTWNTACDDLVLLQKSLARLTHSLPMHPFSTHWKYHKTLRSSDFFRGLRKGVLGTNTLINSRWHDCSPVTDAIVQQSLARFFNIRWHHCSTVSGTVLHQSS